MLDKYLMTSKGKKRIKERYLNARKRLNETALDHGDKTYGDGGEMGGIADNSDVDSRLIASVREVKKYLEVLARARVVEYPTSVDRVVYGSNVYFLLDGNPIALRIVGYGEELGDEGIIYDYAIAKAMIGKKPGEKTQFNGRSIEILAVSPLPKEK